MTGKATPRIMKKSVVSATGIVKDGRSLLELLALPCASSLIEKKPRFSCNSNQSSSLPDAFKSSQAPFGSVAAPVEDVGQNLLRLLKLGPSEGPSPNVLPNFFESALPEQIVSEVGQPPQELLDPAMLRGDSEYMTSAAPVCCSGATDGGLYSVAMSETPRRPLLLQSRPSQASSVVSPQSSFEPSMSSSDLSKLPPSLRRLLYKTRSCSRSNRFGCPPIHQQHQQQAWEEERACKQLSPASTPKTSQQSTGVAIELFNRRSSCRGRRNDINTNNISCSLVQYSDAPGIGSDGKFYNNSNDNDSRSTENGRGVSCSRKTNNIDDVVVVNSSSSSDDRIDRRTTNYQSEDTSNRSDSISCGGSCSSASEVVGSSNNKVSSNSSNENNNNDYSSSTLISFYPLCQQSSTDNNRCRDGCLDVKMMQGSYDDCSTRNNDSSTCCCCSSSRSPINNHINALTCDSKRNCSIDNRNNSSNERQLHFLESNSSLPGANEDTLEVLGLEGQYPPEATSEVERKTSLCSAVVPLSGRLAGLNGHGSSSSRSMILDNRCVGTAEVFDSGNSPTVFEKLVLSISQPPDAESGKIKSAGPGWQQKQQQRILAVRSESTRCSGVGADVATVMSLAAGERGAVDVSSISPPIAEMTSSLYSFSPAATDAIKQSGLGAVVDNSISKSFLQCLLNGRELDPSQNYGKGSDGETVSVGKDGCGGPVNWLWEIQQKAAGVGGITQSGTAKHGLEDGLDCRRMCLPDEHEVNSVAEDISSSLGLVKSGVPDVQCQTLNGASAVRALFATPQSIGRASQQLPATNVPSVGNNNFSYEELCSRVGARNTVGVIAERESRKCKEATEELRELIGTRPPAASESRCRPAWFLEMKAKCRARNTDQESYMSPDNVLNNSSVQIPSSNRQTSPDPILEELFQRATSTSVNCGVGKPHSSSDCQFNQSSGLSDSDRWSVIRAGDPNRNAQLNDAASKTPGWFATTSAGGFFGESEKTSRGSHQLKDGWNGLPTEIIPHVRLPNEHKQLKRDEMSHLAGVEVVGSGNEMETDFTLTMTAVLSPRMQNLAHFIETENDFDVAITTLSSQGGSSLPTPSVATSAVILEPASVHPSAGISESEAAAAGGLDAVADSSRIFEMARPGARDIMQQKVDSAVPSNVGSSAIFKAKGPHRILRRGEILGSSVGTAPKIASQSSSTLFSAPENVVAVASNDRCYSRLTSAPSLGNRNSYGVSPCQQSDVSSSDNHSGGCDSSVGDDNDDSIEISSVDYSQEGDDMKRDLGLLTEKKTEYSSSHQASEDWMSTEAGESLPQSCSSSFSLSSVDGRSDISQSSHPYKERRRRRDTSIKNVGLQYDGRQINNEDTMRIKSMEVTLTGNDSKQSVSPLLGSQVPEERRSCGGGGVEGLEVYSNAEAEEDVNGHGGDVKSLTGWCLSCCGSNSNSDYDVRNVSPDLSSARGPEAYHNILSTTTAPHERMSLRECGVTPASCCLWNSSRCNIDDCGGDGSQLGGLNKARSTGCLECNRAQDEGCLISGRRTRSWNSTTATAAAAAVIMTPCGCYHKGEWNNYSSTSSATSFLTTLRSAAVAAPATPLPQFRSLVPPLIDIGPMLSSTFEPAELHFTPRFAAPKFMRSPEPEVVPLPAFANSIKKGEQQLRNAPSNVDLSHNAKKEAKENAAVATVSQAKANHGPANPATKRRASLSPPLPSLKCSSRSLPLALKVAVAPDAIDSAVFPACSPKLRESARRCRHCRRRRCCCTSSQQQSTSTIPLGLKSTAFKGDPNGGPLSLSASLAGDLLQKRSGSVNNCCGGYAESVAGNFPRTKSKGPLIVGSSTTPLVVEVEVLSESRIHKSSPNKGGKALTSRQNLISSIRNSSNSCGDSFQSSVTTPARLIPPSSRVSQIAVVNKVSVPFHSSSAEKYKSIGATTPTKSKHQFSSIPSAVSATLTQSSSTLSEGVVSLKEGQTVSSLSAFSPVAELTCSAKSEIISRMTSLRSGMGFDDNLTLATPRLMIRSKAS